MSGENLLVSGCGENKKEIFTRKMIPR